MYAKNVKFTSGFLCCSFVEGKTKEAKKYREMFSYQKLGKTEQK